MLDRPRCRSRFPRSSRASSPFREVLVAIGPFGPYVTDGLVSASLKKDMDPGSLGLAQAIELLAAKRERLERLGRMPPSSLDAAQQSAKTKAAAAKRAQVAESKASRLHAGNLPLAFSALAPNPPRRWSLQEALAAAVKRDRKAVGKGEPKEEATPKAVNSWIEFVRLEGALLRQQQPGLSAVEVSKQLSERWKAMSLEEKDKFKHPQDV